MPAIRPSEFIPLYRLLEICENQYRSKDGTKDYDPTTIDQLIHDKQTKQAERETLQHLKELEQYEKDKKELATLIKRLRISGNKFLSDFTMRCVVQDIQKEVPNYV